MLKEKDQIKLIQNNIGFLYPYGLENSEIFWPAMIIPHDQLDKSLPKVSKKEMILQFFEKKIAIVDKNDPTFVKWDSNIEPFKSFTKNYYHHKTPYIRKAAVFMATGDIDQSLKWVKWKQISKQSSCENNLQVSDLSDWTDASLSSFE
jgi:hypothetical protein